MRVDLGVYDPLHRATTAARDVNSTLDLLRAGVMRSVRVIENRIGAVFTA